VQKNALSDEIEQIRAIDGVTEVYEILNKKVLYSPSGELYERMKTAYSAILQNYLNYNYDLKKNVESDILSVSFWAIPDDILYRPASTALYEGNYSESLFKSGKYAAISKYYDHSYETGTYYHPGETIALHVLKKEYSILFAAETPQSFLGKYLVNEPINQYELNIFLPYSVFIDEFSDGVADTVCFNIEPGKYDQVRAELDAKFGSGKYTIDDRREGQEQLKSRINAIGLVGYSFSIIMLLIGIMNYVNSIICGIYARRHEFALLEAVGMTKAQFNKMQIFEGLYFLAAIFLISIVIGVPGVTKMGELLVSTNLPMNFISPLIMMALLAAAAFTVIIAAIHIISSETTVERLKQSE
jgi:putative ABC transport system permease protein